MIIVGKKSQEKIDKSCFTAAVFILNPIHSAFIHMMIQIDDLFCAKGETYLLKIQAVYILQLNSTYGRQGKGSIVEQAVIAYFYNS